MVSDITGIDYEILKDNVVLEVNELPISKINEKAKRCDFIIRILDDMIINLELNSFKYTGLIVKNLSYLANIFASSTKRGEEYNENMLVLQINLNCYEKNNDNILSHYVLQEQDTYVIYSKNISIYDLNVEKSSKLYYNQGKLEEIPNYIKWGALLYCDDFNKIPNIVEGIVTDEERDTIMSKLNKLTSDNSFMTEVEAMDWAEWERRSIETEFKNRGHAEGRAEGHAEGHAEGYEEGIALTIRNMKNNNIDLNVISKITGKSIEEIKEIIE